MTKADGVIVRTDENLTGIVTGVSGTDCGDSEISLNWLLQAKENLHAV